MSKVQFDVVAQNNSRIEGMSANFLIDAYSPHRDTGYAEGEELNYRILGLDENDLSSFPLTGTIVLDANLQALISIPLKIDNQDEGSEELRLQVYDDLFLVESQMTINDGAWENPAYRFDVVAQNTSVMEGWQVRFLINAESPHHEVVYEPGHNFFYEVSGLSGDDLDGVSLSGSVSLGEQNEALITIPIKNDDVIEGEETLTILVRSDYESASSSVVIRDFEFLEVNDDSNNVAGGEGIDVLYTEWAKESSRLLIQENSVVVETLVAGDLRTVELAEVERIRFNDSFVAVDIDGVSGKAFRVYKAAFDRDPMDGDSGGLGYWIAQMDDGMDMVEVAARFIDSDEFRSLYGQNPTNGEFLNKIYLNVLDRLPDAGGYDWWMDQLENNPEKTWEKVLADFSESAENQANVADVVANGIVFDPWVG